MRKNHKLFDSVFKMASRWWLLDHCVLFSAVAALAGIVFGLILVTISLWLAFLKGKLNLLLKCDSEFHIHFFIFEYALLCPRWSYLFYLYLYALFITMK